MISLLASFQHFQGRGHTLVSATSIIRQVVWSPCVLGSCIFRFRNHWKNLLVLKSPLCVKIFFLRIILVPQGRLFFSFRSALHVLLSGER